MRLLNNFVRLFSDKGRGFGFVEFESEEDCADAIENMEGSELFGKVLRCNIAKPMSKAPSGKAVWSADEWIQNSLKDGDDIDAYDEGEGAYGTTMAPINSVNS
jgi:RNA recognition motif-containing protein